MPWSWYFYSLLVVVLLYLTFTGTGWVAVGSALGVTYCFLAYATYLSALFNATDIEDTSCNQ